MEPIPDVLTVKQVAARWRAIYNNGADEDYVLACYGKLQFCQPFVNGLLVKYSREDMLESAAKEDGPLAALEVAEGLPEYEKKILRVRREDLLAYENGTQAKPGKANMDKLSPPGRMPRNGGGKLVVYAAWVIECEENRSVTPIEIMNRLRLWSKEGIPEEISDKVDVILCPHDPSKPGVFWERQRNTAKELTLNACAKAIRTWNDSRG